MQLEWGHDKEKLLFVMPPQSTFWFVKTVVFYSSLPVFSCFFLTRGVDTFFCMAVKARIQCELILQQSPLV